MSSDDRNSVNNNNNDNEYNNDERKRKAEEAPQHCRQPPGKRRRTTDNVAEPKSPTSSKRCEADVRNEMLEKGALLLEFHVARRPGTLTNFDKQGLDRWRAVEKKGFLVTDKGCLFPAECHVASFDKRSKKVGYDCALKFFSGKERDPSTAGSVNEHGWDCEETVSHLCHRNRCCAYPHLELVPRWKNLKRNYCGAEGRCDCGMDPPCADTYHPPSFARRPDTLLTYDTPGLSAKVKALLEREGVTVKILPKDRYRKQDLKRENRKERIKASIETARRTAVNDERGGKRGRRKKKRSGG